MTTATCPDTTCPEVDLPKTVPFELGPDDVVVCGGCGTPCVIADEA